jgi:hypothetical protein
MRFLSSDLGFAAGGSTVVVELSGTEANVMLLDDANLARYQRGQEFSYRGGHFTSSPARIGVPWSGRWHLVVDLGGFGGSVEASVRVVAPSRSFI